MDDFLKNNSQAHLHALKVEGSMALLAEGAVLEVILDEANALNKKEVEEFICAFCANFPKDPLICSECEKVFC